jgi:hypothetical protein
MRRGAPERIVSVAGAQEPSLSELTHLLSAEMRSRGTFRGSTSDPEMYDECFESFTPVTNICR